jgi:hypothetical protein
LPKHALPFACSSGGTSSAKEVPPHFSKQAEHKESSIKHMGWRIRDRQGYHQNPDKPALKEKPNDLRALSQLNHVAQSQGLA